MKKLLSYLMVFVMVFAISTTVTIKVKSELLKSNQTAVVAEASGETSLLSGVMNSLEKHPKLNVGGSIGINLQEEEIAIDLNADINFKELTNPEVNGIVTITHNNNELNLFLTYLAGTIYIEYGNAKIKASIADINGSVETISGLLGDLGINLSNETASAVDGLSQSFANISVDTLLDALSNPKKTAFDEYDQYEISLPGICEVVLVCDDKFNINSVSIKNFELIENVDISANLFVSQDDKIQITEPDSQDYFDIAAAIDGIGELFAEDYLHIDSWATLYKNSKLFEHAKLNANLAMADAAYGLSGKLTGAIEGDFDLKYLQDTVYAKFNGINLSAKADTIAMLVEQIKLNFDGLDLQLPDIDVQNLVTWIKNNYKNLLDNAVISNSRIKLNLDLSNFFEGLNNLQIYISFTNSKIDTIVVEGLTFGDYYLRFGVYMSYPTNISLSANPDEYFELETACGLIQTIKNLEKFEVSSNINATINQKDYSANINVLGDIQNSNYQASIHGLFDLDIDFVYLNSELYDYPIYLRVGDIYLSVPKNYLTSLVGDKIEQAMSNMSLPQKEEIFAMAQNLLSEYFIGDILKLSEIELSKDTLKITTNLSPLVHKICKLNLTAKITTTSLVVESFEVQYDNFVASGNFAFSTTNKQVQIENPTQYLDIKWLVNNLQRYLSSEELLADVDLSVQQNQQSLIDFVGELGINMSDAKLELDGKFNNLFGKFSLPQNIKVVYDSQVIYLEYGEQKFNISEDALNRLLAIFGYDISDYISMAKDAMAQISSFNIYNYLSQTIADIDVSAVDISAINVNEESLTTIIDLIKKVKINSDTISFAGDIAGTNIDATIKLYSKHLVIDAKIGMQDIFVAAKVDLKQQAANFATSQDSICLDPIANVAANVAEIASSPAFEGVIELSLGEEDYKNISISYKLAVDLNERSIRGMLATNIFGKDVKVRIENTSLFVEIDGIFVSCTIDELMSILNDDLIADYIPEQIKSFDIHNIDIDALISKAIELLAENKIIYNLAEQNDQLAINLLDKLDLVVSELTNNSAVIDIAINNVTARVTLAAREELELEEIDQSKYTSATKVFGMAKYAYNYLTSKKYYANLNANILYAQNKSLNISGYVGFDEETGLVLDANTTILGKSLRVIILNKVVYINFDGFKAELSFAAAYKLLEQAVQTFEINIDQNILTLVEQILTQEEISLQDILTQAAALVPQDLNVAELISNTSIALENNILSLDVFGTEVAVVFDDNNNLISISAEYEQNIGFDAEIVFAQKQAIELADEYASLDDAWQLLPSIKALIAELQYNANIVLSIKDYQFNVIALVKIADGHITIQASADIFNKQALITFAYDAGAQEYALYVTIDGINIRATLDDVPAVIEWINTTFAKDIQIDIEFIKSLLADFSIEKLLGKFDLSKLDLTINDNVVSVGFDKLDISLTMAEQVAGSINIDDSELCTLTLAQQSVDFAALEDEYLPFENVFSIITNAYDYITGKAYYANISASASIIIDEQTTMFDITGYIGYDAEGLVLDVHTTILGKSLRVTILNKVVYINFDGFKAKLSFADAYALLKQATETFDLDISAEILELAEYLLTSQEYELASLLDKAQALMTEPLDIEELVGGASITLSLEQLLLNIMGANIVVDFEDSNIDSIAIGYESDKFELDAQIELTQKQNILVSANEYANLADAKNILSSIKNIIDNKQLVGTININFDKIDVTGTYQLSFVDGLALSLSFNVYGLDISVVLQNKTLYVAIEDIKVKAALDDIDDILAWASTTFNKEINLDTSVLSESFAIGDLLDQLDFSKLSLSIVGSKVTLAFGELFAEVTFGDTLGATIIYQKAAEQGEEQRKPLIITLDAIVENTQIEVQDADYQNYTILTDLIDSVMEIVNSKRVSVTLPSIKVYEGSSVHYTASGSLQLDLSDENNKLFHAQVVVHDLKKEKDYDVRLSYKNNYWWVYFNNLKVKMHKNDVKELLAIVCKVMDLDTTLIPGLAEVSANLDDINFDSLSAILPNFSDFDPLSILGYIKSLTLQNGQLICDVDGSLVTDNLDATDMRVIVDATGGRLSGIYGQNIYTGVTNAEHFDIELLVNASFSGVGSSASGTYIDLSGSNELIKALFNTAELNYFNVSGNISASLGSWNLVDIPIVLQVKLDDNRKPTIYAKLDLSVLTDSIISSVANGIVFESNYKNNHIVQIYYKDDYVYFYSTGNSSWSLFSGTTYAAKMVKVHIDSLLEDPMYYLSFALSFSDTIQNEIDSSLESTAGYEPDLGKIIKSYTVKNSKDFSVVLDMAEISGNDMLSDTTINIGVINNSSTGYKNYLGTAGFDFQLSVGLTIHLSSSDLKLINIGQSINFASIDSFINNYAYGEGREMESTNGGSSYSQTGGKKYSVSFNSNGGASVATKTDYPGTTFALPTLANKVVTGGGTKEVYAFAGWYEDSTLLKTPYTSGQIGHKNITVYAKWELIESYRTISFYLDGNNVANVLALVGSEISYSGLQQSRIIESGGYKYYQSFDKYTDINGNMVSVVGNVSQNVYINYINTLVLKAYTLSIDTGVAAAVASNSVYETESYLSLLPVYTTLDKNVGDIKYTYSFEGFYNESDYQTLADGTMPSANKTIYAKWVLTHTYTTIYYYLDGAELTHVQALVGTNVLTPAELSLANSRVVYSADSSIKYEQSNPQIVDGNGNPISAHGCISQIAYVQYNNDATKYLHTVTYNTGIEGSDIQSISVYSTEGYAIPTMPANIEIYNSDQDATFFYRFDGWYLDNTFTIAADGTMPNSNITLFALWTYTHKLTTRLLTIYDNGTEVFSQRFVVGEPVDMSGSGLKIDADTQWYEDSYYNVSTNFPETMEEENIILHIRNKYNFMVTTYQKSGNSYIQTTTTTSVYQGDTIAYYQTTFEPIYSTNNSITNGRKDTYTSTGFKEGNTAYSGVTMPNRDLSITEGYSVSTAYLIQFITNTTYTVTHKGLFKTYNVSMKSPTNTPSDTYVTAGTTITVSNYYNNGTPTRQGTYKVGITYTLTFTATSWSKTDSGSGGSATWKIDQATKLYAVWKES